MKAYTIRMEDQDLYALKQKGLREHRTIKDIIMEAIRETIHKKVEHHQSLKEKKMFERAAVLASRLSIEDVVKSIREDRER